MYTVSRKGCVLGFASSVDVIRDFAMVIFPATNINTSSLISHTCVMGMHEFSTEYHPAGHWELFCDGQCVPRKQWGRRNCTVPGPEALNLGQGLLSLI